MACQECGSRLDASDTRCWRCGRPNPQASRADRQDLLTRAAMLVGLMVLAVLLQVGVPPKVVLVLGILVVVGLVLSAAFRSRRPWA